MTLGTDFADEYLDFEESVTGKKTPLKVGNFFNSIVTQSMARSSNPLNIFFHELLPYCLSLEDQAYRRNV